MKNQFTTFENFRGATVKEIEFVDSLGSEKKHHLRQPVGLQEDIVQILQHRIGGEYNAHFAYRAAANWCKNVNYKKAAAFFDSGADEELEHAKDLQNYLTQWNVLPVIPKVDPDFKFDNLPQIISEIYGIEYDLLINYSEDALSVLKSHPATFDFLQKYIDIQNKSVAEFSDLLNGLQLINIDNKLDLLFFEERYF